MHALRSNINFKTSQWIKVVIVWLEFCGPIHWRSKCTIIYINSASMFTVCLPSIWLFAFRNCSMDAPIHTQTVIYSYNVHIGRFIQLCAKFTIYIVSSAHPIYTTLSFNFEKPPSEEKWSRKENSLVSTTDNTILFALCVSLSLSRSHDIEILKSIRFTKWNR